MGGLRRASEQQAGYRRFHGSFLFPLAGRRLFNKITHRCRTGDATIARWNLIGGNDITSAI
jgi:hypothetical protein